MLNIPKFSRNNIYNDTQNKHVMKPMAKPRAVIISGVIVILY